MLPPTLSSGAVRRIKVAVIGDVHGNLPALEAVLDAVRQDDADVTVCLGDLAWKGTFPSECVARIRDLGCRCVCGNGDLYLIAAAGLPVPYAMPEFSAESWRLAGPYLRWHTERLGSQDLDYLAALPFEVRLADERGRQLLFVHGTPQDCFAGITAGMPADALDQTVTPTGADWLVVGHTHIPLVMSWRKTVIFNPGAIGCSLDGNWHAAYGILDTLTGSTSIKRVPYDVEGTLRAADDRDFCFPKDEYRNALTGGMWTPKPWRERACCG